MKNYFDLINFIEKNKISLDTEILMPVREKVFTDVKYLKLAIQNNSLAAYYNKKDLNNIQLEINTVKDVIYLKNKGIKNWKKRILQQPYNIIESPINFVVYKGNNNYFSSYFVDEFIYKNNKLLFDYQLN